MGGIFHEINVMNRHSGIENKYICKNKFSIREK